MVTHHVERRQASSKLPRFQAYSAAAADVGYSSSCHRASTSVGKGVVMTRFFALSLVLCTVSLPGQSGTVSADVVPLAERLAITSKILDEERTYLVRTPRGYDPKESYPLLVLLDGIDHLGYVSGVADFLASNGRVPPMLIVAIENTNRARDLLQPSDNATTEGAEKFLAFIADELIPDVGTKYPLKPYRILVGHSNAGTFTVFPC
jgi:enterochelin esterase-like enzyme